MPVDEALYRMVAMSRANRPRLPCRGIAVPLATESKYDFRELGAYLGNVGLKVLLGSEGRFTEIDPGDDAALCYRLGVRPARPGTRDALGAAAASRGAIDGPGQDIVPDRTLRTSSRRPARLRRRRAVVAAVDRAPANGRSATGWDDFGRAKNATIPGACRTACRQR